MNKKIVIGGLVCALGFTGIFGFSVGSAFSFFENSSIELPLKSVSFSKGGDMQGSHHAMSVEAIDDKSALVCYEDASWHHEVPVVKEYIVPRSVLDEVKDIFNKNKLAKCEKAPNSKFFAYDAATSSYYFTFEKKNVHFSSTQELSRENYDALSKIKKCVADACQLGERIPGLVVEKDAQGNMPTKTFAVKGKMGIKVISYRKNVLNIAIGNGIDEDKEISLKSKITEVGNPDKVIAEQITDEKKTVSSHYNDEYRWEMDKRLDAGKYCLNLGGYITEFEIR